MGLYSFFERIKDEKEPDGSVDAALQKTLGAASAFYGAGASVNRLAYATGLRARRVLPATVLSVGNITLGGTGKTPFTVWLARWLREEGRRPAILTRGYGREDEDRLVVVHNGKRRKAELADAGDEPFLLAERLENTPILAAADRYRAGRAAIRHFEVDTLVLDDGFQHHALARNGDIVLVDALRPLSELRVFPRGTLRESPRVLAHAHLIVVTRADIAENLRSVMRQIRRFAPSVPIVRTAMKITGARRVVDEEPVDLDTLRGERVAVACAVGNPDSVRLGLEKEGIEVAAMRQFPDHEPIPRRDIVSLSRLRKARRYKAIIVTEKDAVKIDSTRIPKSLVSIRTELEFLTPKDRRLAEKVLRARLAARLVRGFLGA